MKEHDELSICEASFRTLFIDQGRNSGRSAGRSLAQERAMDAKHGSLRLMSKPYRNILVKADLGAVTVLEANPESCRDLKKEIARLSDIVRGLCWVIKEDSLRKAESYWRLVDCVLSASINSILVESIWNLLFAENLRKSIKLDSGLSRTKQTQSSFGQLVIVLDWESESIPA